MARGYSQSRTEATPRVNPEDSPAAQLNQRSAQYFNGIRGEKVSQVANFEQTKGKNYDKVKDLRGPELKNAILKEIKKVEKEGLLRTSYPKEIFDGYKIKATTEGKYIPTMNIRAVYPAGHPISVAAEKARNAIDEAFEKGGNKQTPEVTAIRKQWSESTEGSAGLTLGNKLKTIVESHKVSNIANDGSDSAGANFTTPHGYVYFTDSTGRTRTLPR
jgi:hypothetical protein